MTTNMFAPERETAARDRGMKLAADRKRDLLENARHAAVHLAQNHPRRLCTVEDVRKFFADCTDFEPGNWMGSIFKTNDWEATDMRTNVSHNGGHRREVKVWRLK